MGKDAQKFLRYATGFLIAAIVFQVLIQWLTRM